MATTIFIGLILFTFALIVYSVATWASVRSGIIKKWHLVILWLGLVADLSATLAIGYVYGGFQQNLHSYIGAIALFAVLAQNILATKAFKDKDEKKLASFPKKLFIPVWVIWMASYIAGLLLSGGSR